MRREKGVGILVRDIRYGLRMLARNSRLTLLTATILGLAIGGSAAIFVLIDAVFLRPLAGVSAPEQLVRFERVQPGLSATNFSYPDYLAYRDETRAFSGLAAHLIAPLSFSGSITQRIRGDLVTGNYFSVLGARPALGRLFDTRDDGAPGANPVAVLGYALWQRAFGSDAEIAGKSITLNGHAFEIVGVAEPNFTGTQVGEPDEVWIPLSMQKWGIPRLSPDILNSRAAGWIDVFGRLRGGVRLTQAQADMATVAERLAKEFPVTNAHRRIRLLAGVGMDPDDEQDVGRLLALLMSAVAILLMTAAANAATLLLARGMGRQHDDENAPGVAIVNEALARRMWPGQDAVGKQIVWPSFERANRPPLTVVGVVGNTRQRALGLEAPAVFYVPIAQSYTPAITLLVRTEGDPMALRHAVESQIRSVDTRLPVFRVQTLEEHVSDSLWRQRAALGMIGSFGGLSVLIAAIGLYGVLSQWVLQRMRDIAIRVALGAKRADVIGLVWRETFTLVWMGSAFGLLGTILAAFAGYAASVDLSRYAKPWDATVIGLAALVLTAVALGSSAIPAMRALRGDPATALHAE